MGKSTGLSRTQPEFDVKNIWDERLLQIKTKLSQERSRQQERRQKQRSPMRCGTEENCKKSQESSPGSADTLTAQLKLKDSKLRESERTCEEQKKEIDRLRKEMLEFKRQLRDNTTESPRVRMPDKNAELELDCLQRRVTPPQRSLIKATTPKDLSGFEQMDHQLPPKAEEQSGMDCEPSKSNQLVVETHDNNKATETITDLESRLVEANEEIISLRRCIETLERENKVLGERGQQLEDQVNEMAASMHRKSLWIKYLEQGSQHQNVTIDALTQQVSDLKSDVELTGRINVLLRQNLNLMKDEKQLSDARIRRLESEVALLEGELEQNSINSIDLEELSWNSD